MSVRILIVEDEGIVAQDLAMTVAGFGYEVMGIVDSAAAARAAVAAQRPDLVLLDIRLRGREDGIDLADHLIAGLGIGVVFLTSHSDEATLARAKRTGPLAYLLKPFDERELRITLEMARHKHLADRLLVERERQLREVLQHLGDAVVLVAADDRVLFLNDAAERCCLADAVGLPIGDVLPLRAAAAEAMVELPATGAFAGRVETPHGDLHVEGHVVAVGGADGLRMVSFRDVTDRLQRERLVELEQRQSLQTQRLATLSTLAGIMAHDLNNLLTPVLGHAELLLQQMPAGAPLREGIERIAEAARLAARRASQMLAYSGNARFDSVRIMPAAWLRELDGELRQLAGGDGLQVACGADVPAVIGDAQALRQALFDLLRRAVEVSPADAVIEIECRRKACTSAWLAGCFGGGVPPGDYVALSVRDRGARPDTAQVEQLFDPFRTSGGRDRRLGLAAALGIARSHGGAVHIAAAADGVGTMLTLLLPCASTEGARPAAATTAPRSVARNVVLVVDDDPGVRELARTVLAPQHELVMADSVASAIAAFAAEPQRYGMLLVDLTLPDGSGVEVLRRARQLRPDVPVVVSTGYTEESIAALRAEDPTLGFLPKPFAVGELRALVAARLRG